MALSENIKRAVGAVIFAAIAGGYYWWEHRPEPAEKETQGQAQVVVTKSTNACFSDQVRVTGFVVPRREAVVGADQEGSKVTDLLVREGDVVTDNQELARLSAPSQAPQQQQQGGKAGPSSLRAPAPGLLTEVRTIVGAPASPQAGPMFRIAVNSELELDAEVPSVHLSKLNPGATVRVSTRQCPRPDRTRSPGLAADRPHDPARQGQDFADQQPVPESRNVRARQYRRQAQLRRRRSPHRHRPPHRAGGQGQYGGDTQGTGRPDLRYQYRNPRRSRSRRNRRGGCRHFAA